MIKFLKLYATSLIMLTVVCGSIDQARAAGGSSGGSGSSSGSSGSSAGGAGAASPGGVGTPSSVGGSASASGMQSNGLSGSTPAPGKRKAVEDGLRKIGQAPSPAQDQQELRSLNQISRQVAPNVPIPAPEVNR